MAEEKSVYKFAQACAPLLQSLLELGGSAHKDDVFKAVAQKLPLDYDELPKSARSSSSKFRSQVSRAHVCLRDAGYLKDLSPGIWLITESGRTHANMDIEDAVNLVHNRRVKANARRAAK